jgi:hypothetical protein
LSARVGERISKLGAIEAFDRKFQATAPEHRDGRFVFKRLTCGRKLRLVVIGSALDADGFERLVCRFGLGRRPRGLSRWPVPPL